MHFKYTIKMIIIKDNHIDFIRRMMKKERTKNLSLEKKLRITRDEFPELKISRSTFYNI